MVLLTVSGLLVRSFASVYAVAGGFDSRNLLLTDSDGGLEYPEAIAFWRGPLEPLSAAAQVVLPSLIVLLGYWLSGLFFVEPDHRAERWLQGVDDALLTRTGTDSDTIEYVREVLVADAATLVLDDDARSTVGSDVHDDGAASRRVADRVVHEDRDELTEPVRITGQGHGRGVQPQLDATVAGAGVEPGQRRAGGVCQVDGDLLKLDRPGVAPR